MYYVSDLPKALSGTCPWQSGDVSKKISLPRKKTQHMASCFKHVLVKKGTDLSLYWLTGTATNSSK